MSNSETRTLTLEIIGILIMLAPIHIRGTALILYNYNLQNILYKILNMKMLYCKNILCIMQIGIYVSIFKDYSKIKIQVD